jgi:hypothetical protein
MSKSFRKPNHQFTAVFNRMMQKAWKALPIVIDTNNDISKAVIVAGAGRSGTTWIADILNYKNDYRLMFEPFQGRRVRITRHFKHGQYLRPDDQNEAFLEPLRAILSGSLKHSGWIDRPNRKLICKKRLIKIIHGNLLLKWINVHFPQIPIILILRHPCAVARSRLVLSHWDWAEDFQECIGQEQLIEDFLSPVISEIKNVQDVFEMHIFSWCVANYVPLRQFQRGEIHLVFYENLCTKPEVEVDRLFSFLDEPYDQRVFKHLKKPSQVTRRKSAINTGKSLIDDFKNHISRSQIQRAVEILSLFGLDKVYSEGPMPLVNGEQNPLVVGLRP